MELSPFVTIMLGIFFSKIFLMTFQNGQGENINFYNSIINENSMGILLAIYYNPELSAYIPNILIAGIISKLYY